MKKMLLMLSIFIVIVVIGIAVVSNKGNYSSRHENIDVADAILDSEAKTFQEEENSKKNYESIPEEFENVGDSMVFREYAWGLFLKEGNIVLIEKDRITCDVENVQNVVIVLNDNAYKEFAFDGNDIEYTVMKNGNYAFFAIDSDGNSVDIMPLVTILRPADGGTIFLN